MAISLTKPAVGSTGWGADVNTNFTTIENAFNGSQAIGPLVMNEDDWIGIGSTSERLVFDGTGGFLTVTAADLNLASGQVLRVNATQVVGAQQSAISDTTVQGNNKDSISRQAINDILAALRTHGLIAT